MPTNWSTEFRLCTVFFCLQNLPDFVTIFKVINWFLNSIKRASNFRSWSNLQFDFIHRNSLWVIINYSISKDRNLKFSKTNCPGRPLVLNFWIRSHFIDFWFFFFWNLEKFKILNKKLQCRFVDRWSSNRMTGSRK